jgi:hypothetical protein
VDVDGNYDFVRWEPWREIIGWLFQKIRQGSREANQADNLLAEMTPIRSPAKDALRITSGTEFIPALKIPNYPVGISSVKGLQIIGLFTRYATGLLAPQYHQPHCLVKESA